MTTPLADRDADDILSLADIAEATGLAPASVRTYHTDSTTRRRKGESLPQDMPEPDIRIGRTPGWKVSTVEVWIEARRAAGERNAERLKAPRPERRKVTS